VGGLHAAGRGSVRAGTRSILTDETFGLNEVGQILGRGELENGSPLAFLLVPVPEARSVVLLLGAGLVALVRGTRAAG